MIPQMNKTYQYVLAIDPSGSFEEGKGCTGWVLATGDGKVLRFGKIDAVEFIAAEHYWSEHIDLIEEIYSKYGEDLIVVLEDYVLYYEKAIVQSYSKMETSKLIGAVQVYCYNTSIPLILQRAVEIKARWSTEVLLKRNLLKGLGVNKSYALPVRDGFKKINRHILDAYRHMLHFVTFKNNNSKDFKLKTVEVDSYDNYR